jgi:hypothetical protein
MANMTTATNDFDMHAVSCCYVIECVGPSAPSKDERNFHFSVALISEFRNRVLLLFLRESQEGREQHRGGWIQARGIVIANRSYEMFY